MTLTAPPEAAVVDDLPLAPDLVPEAPETVEPSGPAASGAPDPKLVALCAVLAVAGVGWMFAGVFASSVARGAGLLAAVLGVGTVLLSYRTQRPALLQYSVPVVGAAVGAVLALLAASGGDTNLPSLVAAALRQGGVSHPPVPFDPGWRFILVLLVTSLGGATTTVAVTVGRPKLAILIPVPLIFLGALVQPPHAVLASSVVSFVFLAAAFGASYAVDLAREGANTRRYEGRRLMRAAAVLVVLVVALVGLSSSGLLLPKAKQSVVPPQFPQNPPAPPPGVLFTATMPQPMPLRLGVLDVYRNVAWLTPPFSSARFQTTSGETPVRAGSDAGDAPPPSQSPADPADVRVDVTIRNLGGHALPDVANPIAVPHSGYRLQYDPRTQALWLPDRLAPARLSYTEIAAPIPTGRQLEASGAEPAGMAQYLAAPPAPAAVQALLAKAPTTNLFDRLQYVRTVYEQHVVAAGTGKPVAVPPDRVAQLLAGRPGSPFEIVAAEAVLARWAGVPSRIGYGYYSTKPDRPGSDVYSLTADDGSVWLEAYFDHYGWVPIVGTPPKAQASLDNKPKKQNPAILPSPRLDLVIYLPVKQQTIQQLYEVVRYWVIRALPLLVGLVLAVLFYPGLIKALRHVRRRRWAGDDPRALVAVAYAELRDQATDLNVGDPAHTPLEFLDVVDDDAEHGELAWLVTRVLWGDLVRDAQIGDAELATDMAASVRRRLRRASPAINRIIAFGSRASLRDPYSTELPNLWPQWSPRRRLARTLSRSRRPRPVGWRRVLTAAPRAVVAIAASLGLAGCGRAAVVNPHPAVPARIVPAAVGGVTFVEERAVEKAFTHAPPDALVATGKVFSIHMDGTVQGDLQVAAFRPQYSARLDGVEQSILDGIAGRQFQLTRAGNQLLYVAQRPNEQLFMSFSRDGTYYELMDAEASFVGAEDLFLSVLNYQQGGAAVADAGVPPLDPRQGGDYSEEGQ